MAKVLFFLCGMVLILSMWACRTSHKVEVAPVEIKPIHITIDVNVKVDKELDNFFSDLDETEARASETSPTEE